MWPLVGTLATDVNTEPDWSRTTGMALSSSPGQDVTMAPGGKEAMLISLFLTAFASSDLPLSTAHEPFCFSFPFLHYTFAYHNSVDLPGALWLWAGPWMFSISPSP